VSIRSFIRGIVQRLHTTERDLGDDIGFVPGLVNEAIRVTCAKKKIDDDKEPRFVCWNCFRPEGLFDPDQSIDVPANTQGAWYRVHKRCS
jgi:hypothetical protein